MSFQKAFDHVILSEGETYTNYRDDHGGPTKFGITLDTLSLFSGRRCIPEDVMKLTMADAEIIYKKLYWTPLQLDRFTTAAEPLAIALFDQAVNFGVNAATKRLQRIINVPSDGVLGPATLAALMTRDANGVAFGFICQSQLAYAELATRDVLQGRWLQGWLKRTHRLLSLLL